MKNTIFKKYFFKKGDRRVEKEPGREDQSEGRGGGNEEEGDEREGKEGSGGLVRPFTTIIF